MVVQDGGNGAWMSVASADTERSGWFLIST